MGEGLPEGVLALLKDALAAFETAQRTAIVCIQVTCPDLVSNYLQIRSRSPIRADFGVDSA